MEFVNDFLSNYGLDDNISKTLSIVILVLSIILICIVVNFIVKKIILKILSKYIEKNKFKWDDYLLQRKVFEKLSMIIPGIIVYSFAHFFGSFSEIIQRFSRVYILIITMTVVNSVVDALHDIYKTHPVSKQRPIKGIIQVFKIGFYIIMGIVIIASLIGESPIILLSGIGALTAVFTLVFKDSILGLVAGIQLSANDMLQIGDWIEMPKYGADGDVIDISLNTVKVQNFDKTIVTIPSYALISDSFRNWRGMREAGGRRVKRSIYIDVNTIKFCSKEMIEKFKKVHFLTEYILNKEKEIEQYNKANNINDELLINGRHLTNIGTFRIYIENYLKNHPMVHKHMIHMVRHLPPGEHGLPLELYLFINDTNWVNYEKAQADIFDHILAVTDLFELKLFQSPSGHDLKNIREQA
ncbi:mechanosensitive ion channel domain-containing protein [Proteiniborus sp. DW1]|uniref:mechanosensitive ion channel family protein n=1 Tax=Proteiniborus sp. DW1 TaxID=1889883 RepID=UPI0009451F58|nr:mechanosensitive ion channel domain-containing protein [Proteiniborus sp. DW1]